MMGDCIIIHGGNKGINPSSDDLYILDFNPSLKMLCKLAVIQHDLQQSELTHDIRWELAAMTANSNKKRKTMGALVVLKPVTFTAWLPVRHRLPF